MKLMLRRAMLVLSVLGIALATYLTIVHYAGLKPACTAGQSCIKVQTSQWSEVGGVPVALLGLIGYVGIFATLAAPDRDESRLATLALTLIGFVFSAYLTYREGHSIHAYCEECLTSAGFMTVLFIAAAYRYVTASALAPAPAAPPPPQPPEPPQPRQPRRRPSARGARR
ncbi:MAG: vitamin K epoxide reductase family protein [Solirubrobacteraceae bacterium]